MTHPGSVMGPGRHGGGQAGGWRPGHAGVEVARLGERALEQEAHRVPLALAQQLNHLGRKEVFVLLQKTLGLVHDAARIVVHREAKRVRLGPHVEFALDVAVELGCNEASLRVITIHNRVCGTSIVLRENSYYKHVSFIDFKYTPCMTHA